MVVDGGGVIGWLLGDVLAICLVWVVLLCWDDVGFGHGAWDLVGSSRLLSFGLLSSGLVFNMSIRCFSRFFLLSSIVNILARSNLLLIRILHFGIFFINHILPWSIITIHIHLRLLIWCSTITRGWRLDYSFWDVLTSSISIYWWLILVWLGLGDNWRCVLVLYNFSWADVFIRVDLLIGVWLDLTPQILLVYIRSRYSLIPIIHSIFVHLNIRIVCCCGLARTCRLVGNYWLLLYLCLSQPIIIATSSVNTIPIPLLLWSNLFRL